MLGSMDDIAVYTLGLQLSCGRGMVLSWVNAVEWLVRVLGR